jgi:hypothetical protein
MYLSPYTAVGISIYPKLGMYVCTAVYLCVCAGVVLIKDLLFTRFDTSYVPYDWPRA